MNVDVGGLGQLSISIVRPTTPSNIYLTAYPVLAMCNYSFVIFLYTHSRPYLWFGFFPQNLCMTARLIVGDIGSDSLVAIYSVISRQPPCPGL